MKLQIIDDYFNPAYRPQDIAQYILGDRSTGDSRAIHDQLIQRILLTNAYDDRCLRELLYDFSRSDMFTMRAPERVLTRRLTMLLGALEWRVNHG